MIPHVLQMGEWTLYYAANRLTWGSDAPYYDPPLPPPLPHTGTMICQECMNNRGLKPEPPAVWIFSTCDICRDVDIVASPLLMDHNTGADLPLDTGGKDGIQE